MQLQILSRNLQWVCSSLSVFSVESASADQSNPIRICLEKKIYLHWTWDAFTCSPKQYIVIATINIAFMLYSALKAIHRWYKVYNRQCVSCMKIWYNFIGVTWTSITFSILKITFSILKMFWNYPPWTQCAIWKIKILLGEWLQECWEMSRRWWEHRNTWTQKVYSQKEHLLQKLVQRNEKSKNFLVLFLRDSEGQELEPSGRYMLGKYFSIELHSQSPYPLISRLKFWSLLLV